MSSARKASVPSTTHWSGSSAARCGCPSRSSSGRESRPGTLSGSWSVSQRCSAGRGCPDFQPCTQPRRQAYGEPAAELALLQRWNPLHILGARSPALAAHRPALRVRQRAAVAGTSAPRAASPPALLRCSTAAERNRARPKQSSVHRGSNLPKAPLHRAHNGAPSGVPEGVHCRSVLSKAAESRRRPHGNARTERTWEAMPERTRSLPPVVHIPYPDRAIHSARQQKPLLRAEGNGPHHPVPQRIPMASELQRGALLPPAPDVDVAIIAAGSEQLPIEREGNAVPGAHLRDGKAGNWLQLRQLPHAQS
jgi:hypothetical protein